MATGLGKTVTAAEILRRRGGRSVWVAHRSELIEQAEKTIGELTGVIPQVEMAERKAQFMFGGNGCVVGSVQTLNAKKNGAPRLNRFNPSFYNTLVTDEAHHAVAKSWANIANHFCENTQLRHLGMTATPDRTDESSLGQIYKTCAYRYDIQDGVKDGWLVPILIQRIYLDSIDLSVIGKVAGDFNQGELAQTMEKDKVIHGVAEALLSEAGNKRTLVFTSSVLHAHALADILNRSKPGMASAIDGKTPKDKRKFILDEYRAGNIQYLCNVGIATEGFDVPNIDCVAIARPTMSRALYAQMVGRGTRPLAGRVDGLHHAEQRLESIASSLKPNCLILDFVGNSGKHKLVSAADVLGGNYEQKVVSEANRMATDEGSPVDTLELLRRAEASVKAAEEVERQRAMRKAVSAKVSYRKKTLDPFDLLDIEPPLEDNDFNSRPLTEKQRQWLEKSGFDVEMMTDGERRKILNQMIYRKKNNLASPKQINLLNRFGYNARSMKMSEASGLIDAIAKNNWKRV
tara:strand:- start:1444 stop:2994 length:1551 start_codon:yes stop_codon:yes gene_type:complete